MTTVDDDEILDAKAAIDRSGIGCEPASAASLAGLRRLVREGIVGSDETAVALLTGHILKDTDAVTAYHFDDVDGAPRPRSEPADPRRGRAFRAGAGSRRCASRLGRPPRPPTSDRGSTPSGWPSDSGTRRRSISSGEPGLVTLCGHRGRVCSMAARTWR